MKLNRKFISLDLNLNNSRSDGYLTVGRLPSADIIVDLTNDWPWLTSSIGRIRAHDIPEEFHKKSHIINEAFRVLKPGGILEVRARSPGATGDPTGNEQNKFQAQQMRATYDFFFKINQTHYPFPELGPKFKVLDLKRYLIDNEFQYEILIVEAIK